MERLTDVTELLDGPLDDPRALADNLRDLRRINRWLGGVSLSRSASRALIDGRAEHTVLDVGTGGADIPLALIERARGKATRVRIVALDSRPEILAAAVRANPRAATTPDLELLLGDGLALPFDDGSFDIVHSSLVVHHLTPVEAVALMVEMRRVARAGIVINDLQRGWLGWIGAWLIGHLLTGNRYTRHDAPLSVRRAYLADEIAGMLRAAGLEPVRTFRAAFGQRYAIAARTAPEPAS
jgi:ubiquinone/menaquinone biosynthesis C-methylase UbiE